jgi:hypothetical protein
MMFDRLITKQQFCTLRQASTPAQTERFDKDKLSWRLSLLVILGLSLALWAAIWEGADMLVRSRL